MASYNINEIRLLAAQKSLKRVLKSKETIYLSAADRNEVEGILRTENIDFAFMPTGFDNSAIIITYVPK